MFDWSLFFIIIRLEFTGAKNLIYLQMLSRFSKQVTVEHNQLM